MMTGKRRSGAVQSAVDKEELREGAMVHAEHVRSDKDIMAQEGLILLPSQKVPVEKLQESVHNQLFDAAKSDEYWNELKTDIVNSGAIIEPLVATRDNVLISGHSRLRIARELVEAGREEFARVPVCYVKGELSEHERRDRVYRSNLLRFELDEDLRIQIHSELYPSVYQTATKGRPAADSATVRLQDIAAQSGLSESTIKRETRIFRRAVTLAREDARERPDKSDIQAARSYENQGRQKSTASRNQSKRKPSRTSPSLSHSRLSELADEFIAARGSAVESKLIHDFVGFVVERTTVRGGPESPKS